MIILVCFHLCEFDDEVNFVATSLFELLSQKFNLSECFVVQGFEQRIIDKHDSQVLRQISNLEYTSYIDILVEANPYKELTN